MPSRTDPGAQLDIFDGRTTVALRIKAAKRQEELTPYGATAAPEGADLAITVLVDIVVEQILVLREKVRRGGSVIVGTHHRVKRRIGSEPLGEAPQRVLMDAYVRINKDQILPSDVSGAVIKIGRASCRERV